LSISGIGYETAKFIAMMGAKVVLACRDEYKANDVRWFGRLFFYCCNETPFDLT
jgi:NAD(P)-dependent dehydrogenase (short-subunit alcohol dehydrogenase family)